MAPPNSRQNQETSAAQEIFAKFLLLRTIWQVKGFLRLISGSGRDEPGVQANPV
jgi:hypothetical protein